MFSAHSVGVPPRSTLRLTRVNQVEGAPAVDAASPRLANSKWRSEAVDEADNATVLKSPTKRINASKRARVILKFSLVKTVVETLVSGSGFVIVGHLSFRSADEAWEPAARSTEDGGSR